MDGIWEEVGKYPVFPELVEGLLFPYRAHTMTAYTSPLLRTLSERGYIHQLTDASGLDALANKQIIPG